MLTVESIQWRVIMQKILCSHIIAACVLLSGCNSSDKYADPNAINGDQYTGTWIAPAYGEAMVVERNRVLYYQYTSEYCIQSDTDNGSNADLEENYWQISVDQQRMRQVLSLYGIDQREPEYIKTDILPESCLQNLVKKKNESGYTADASRDFDFFWKMFYEYYPTFNKRNVDWESQRSELSVSLDANSSDETLFYALAEMIEPLGDSHVTVMLDGSDDEGVNFTRGVTLIDRITEEYISNNGSIDNDQQYSQYLSYLEEQSELVDQIRLSYASDIENIKQAANGNLTWYINSDNIGYLGIENMIFFSGDNTDDISFVEEIDALQSAMQQAMSDLTDTSGLIIDIRKNPGGFDGASQLIARYFLDSERELYSKQARLGDSRTELEVYKLQPVNNSYTKPIVLLTSAMTTSAAEVFALMMRNLPHVTLIGESTQGALSDVLSKSLPNGFKIDLVNEYYLSPEGDFFEVEGVPVDYIREFGTETQRLNHMDDAIELAIELLN